MNGASIINARGRSAREALIEFHPQTMRRVRMVLFVFAAFVALQAHATVLLVEVKREGVVVPEAAVRATGESGDPVIAETGANGVARLEVSPGVYRVEARRRGFRGETTVTVGDEETRVTIELEEPLAMAAPEPPAVFLPAPGVSVVPRVDVEQGKNYAVVNLYYATDRAY